MNRRTLKAFVFGLLFVLVSATAHAQIAYVGGQKELGQSGDPFVTIAYNGTTGSLLVVNVFWKGAVTVSGVTSAAGTFVDSGAGQLDRPVDGHLQVFYALNIAGGSNAATVDFSGAPTAAETNVFIDEYSGVATVSAVDVFNTGTQSSGTTGTTGNLVTTQNDEVIHVWAIANSASAYTAGTNFTLNQVQGGSAATERRVLTATGTYTGDINYNNTITKGGVIAVAFKAPGGAGPALPPIGSLGTLGVGR